MSPLHFLFVPLFPIILRPFSLVPWGTLSYHKLQPSFVPLCLSPLQRLLQWRNGEKMGKESENRDIDKSGACRDDRKGEKAGSSPFSFPFPVSPAHFRFAFPHLLCTLFPLFPFPSLPERRKRPLQRRVAVPKSTQFCMWHGSTECLVNQQRKNADCKLQTIAASPNLHFKLTSPGGGTRVGFG